jgi:hypothetical protein
MKESFEVRYNRALIRTALYQFFAKRLGWSTPLVFFAVVLLLGAVYLMDLWTAIFTWLAALISLSIALLLWIYIVRLRQSESFLSKTKDPKVRYEITSDGLTLSSELGTTELRWEAFDEVLKSETLWLLVYAKSAYLTLPLEALSEKARALIDENIS